MNRYVLIASLCAAVLAVAPGCSDTPDSEPADAPRAFSEAPADGCDPNYANGCVPDTPYDLDCADIGFMVEVVGSDPNRFDADGDGYGCETYG